MCLVVAENGQVGVVASDAIGGPIGLSMSDEQEFHGQTVPLVDSSHIGLPGNTMVTCPVMPLSIICASTPYSRTVRTPCGPESPPIGISTHVARR